MEPPAAPAPAEPDRYMKWDAVANQWVPVHQPPGSPSPRLQYSTQVNKKSINMGHLERMLNDRAMQGWRLAHILEQDGNTIMVFDRQL